MSNNSKIAKNTIYLYIRMAFSMLISLYTVRVILEGLGIEDYGIYSAVGGIISSLTIFTNALSLASQRFYSIEIGKCNSDGLNRVFNSLILLYLLAGVIILIIAETAGVWFLNNKMQFPLDRYDAAFIILQCTLISFFISIIISPFQALIIAKEDMKIYSYVGIYDVVIKLLIAFSLHYFETDKLVLYGVLLLCSSISSQFIYFIYSFKKYKDLKIRFKWDLKTIKNVLGFSSWSFIGCLAFLFNAQGLNLMMNVFFGPIANAAYNIGQSVKNAVNQLGANFFIAVRPSLIKEFAANNFSYVSKLFLFSSKVIFCLLFMAIFPIMIETNGILALWLGEVGEHMVPFVRLMLIWTLILLLSEPITAIVQAANKVKTYHLTVDLFTLLTLPFSYIAFKLGLPPEYAFIISITIFVIAHLIRLFILKRIINFSIIYYLKEIVLKIIIAVIVSYGISCLVFLPLEYYSTLMVFLKIFSNILIAIAVSYLVVLNKDERIRTYELFKMYFNRIFK